MSSLLQRLIGRQLSSVEFVQDYVQLRFDGPCLTAYVMPSVVTRGSSRSFGDSGYRDALCENIGKRVCGVREREAVAVCLDFPGDCSIEICIDGKETGGTEAAVLQMPDNEWTTW